MRSHIARETAFTYLDNVVGTVLPSTAAAPGSASRTASANLV
jgi:hypothetical protein